VLGPTNDVYTVDGQRVDMTPGDVTDKVAVVTGASKSIGAGAAKPLATEGAPVVVNYATRRRDADKVIADITSKGGKAFVIQGDVSKSDDVEHLFAYTHETFGRVDILVNNAGIYHFAPIETVTENDFHQYFDINVLGISPRDSGGDLLQMFDMVSAPDQRWPPQSSTVDISALRDQIEQGAQPQTSRWKKMWRRS
jgi:NAD(P)-dependent dehydrogenase (short-subunit alcohol dehydrogenase family)